MFTMEVLRILDADIIVDEVLMVHIMSISEIQQALVKVVHYVTTNIVEEPKTKPVLWKNCAC